MQTPLSGVIIRKVTFRDPGTPASGYPTLDPIEASKPPLLHLILTGRDAHPEVVSRAHTVTEMKEIKHAYRQEIEPQKGIDY